MTFIPGLGIAKGMALTLRRVFEPKATIMYPEEPADVAVKFRGRLQLLYDEWGTLKCETCFQCAQACPIECIDMGGIDTRGRYHVHWGPPETYGERREESAVRRSGRTVPDPAFRPYEPIDLTAVDQILDEYDFDPAHMLPILEATQDAYGYLPVAALKRISHRTGACHEGGHHLREGCKALPDPKPLDQFGYVFSEMTDEIAAQRDEFAAYLASFEGSHS